MCEILAVRFPEPRPFAAIASWAVAMEHYGSARFGWGVAWLDDAAAPRIRARVGTGQLAADDGVAGGLDGVRSSHFLVHLRRPTMLSTITRAATQPFISEKNDLAFCHNGLRCPTGTAPGSRTGSAAPTPTPICSRRSWWRRAWTASAAACPRPTRPRENLFDVMRFPRLPSSPPESLDALAADAELTEALGPLFTTTFADVLRADWHRYLGHVSDWEISEYREML